MTEEVRTILADELALRLSMATAITQLLLIDAAQRAEADEARTWESIHTNIQVASRKLPPF